MNNKQKLLTATAITGTIVSASAIYCLRLCDHVEEKTARCTVKKKMETIS